MISVEQLFMYAKLFQYRTVRVLVAEEILIRGKKNL